ncbi:MAG: flagellar protein FliT [Pseudomonadota bacterium]
MVKYYLSPGHYARKVLNLTRGMRQQAGESNWQVFAEMEQERQTIIEQLFEHPEMPGALHDIQHLLQDVIDIDRESIALGEAAAKRLGDYLGQRQQARQAMKLYRHHSG